MADGTMWDVVVVGAGNAALSAALAAREHGASVLVIEKAPEHLRGGNTYFTGGGFRFPYDGLDDIRRLIPDITDSEAAQVNVGSYPQSEFYSDLMRVSEGLADEDLIDALAKQAFPTMLWLRDQGMRFALMYSRQAFKQDGKFRFWGGLIVESIGAGKGLIDGLVPIAERAGVEVRYRTAARELLLDAAGGVRGVLVQDDEGLREIEAKGVVLACGGFEANSEMRTRYLGQGWELAKVRGTQFNTGDGIQMALRAGAMPYGHWSGCHAVAWDLNAPPFGDRKIADLFQKHSYPFGLIVNVEGKRFVDEGADFRNYTYARYGKEVLFQPQRAAFQLFDAKVTHLLRDEYKIAQVTKATANTIGELADGLGVDRAALEETVREFNASVQAGDFDPTVKDGKSTAGIAPPKSNWALPLDTPPYEGYAVTCGITFTFGGLRINPACEVIDTRGETIRGLYAAGELVGGLFYFNYAGGSGLMAGATFGRIAGSSAGKAATSVQ